jgi:hypothetical protein
MLRNAFLAHKITQNPPHHQIAFVSKCRESCENAKKLLILGCETKVSRKIIATIMSITEEIVLRANRRNAALESTSPQVKSSSTGHGYEIHVSYGGHVYKQNISNEQIRQAYGQALESNAANI